jgi:LmbE family N-acetylglucosaminyl deacetylase
MNVVVIAPHPDDESIGCGGAICLHGDRGDRATCAFLTSGELGLKHLPRDEAWRVREAEAERAAAVLGAARLEFLRQPDWSLGDATESAVTALAGVLARESPARIYLPHEHDAHPDHAAATSITRGAIRRATLAGVELRGYEVWTPLPAWDVVDDVTGVMARKLRAVRCYASQLTAHRYDRAVRGLNAYRGAMAGRMRFGEAFQYLDAAITPAAPTGWEI